MNVLVIGGNGLLGSYTVMEAIKRGHTVTVLSRGKSMQHIEIDTGIRFVSGDIYTMSKSDFKNVFAEQDAAVYALGLDDREVYDRPIYNILYYDHVSICLNILQLAREFGVKKFVVFGSFFTYFDRLIPELKLSNYHAYIRTRREQSEAAINAAAPGFDTCVLEIPYVIGSLPGRVPPWSFLFKMLTGKGKWAFFFLKGGTAAVTAHQVGEAALGAIERGNRGTVYPLGGINYTWSELARHILSICDQKKKLIHIPSTLFMVFGFLSSFLLLFRNKARGLNLTYFASFQYRNAFIAPEPSMNALGYNHDDYFAALSDMIREWKVINRK